MNKGKKILISSILLLLAISVTGCSNNTPYIGDNGNWWIKDSDTGVPAQGPQGPQGEPGSNGIDGENGINGESVSVVSVEKTNSENNVDTYTITFSDGSKSTFTVTNGEDGDSISVVSVTKTNSDGLVDTYEIEFSNGSKFTFTVTNGKDGECVTIDSIEKTSSEGLIDTYTITLSDGNKFTFAVTNGEDGEDGLTPYIGENGNWWIGDEDTGVFAEYNYETREITNGLTFTATTIDGVGGYVVTSYDPEIAFGEEEYNLLRTDPETYAPLYGVINIPDYIGTVPVIGIQPNVFSGSKYISKFSLSRNTIYLEDNAFKDCSNLKEFDFNNAKLESIPNYAFYNNSLTDVVLPSTVKSIGLSAFANNKLSSIEFPDSLVKLEDRAFYNNKLRNVDVNNVKYFGEESLYCISGKPVYLTKDVEYVGEKAFSGAYVYIEHQSIPSSWATNICSNNSSSSELWGKVIPNCLRNEEYIYSKTLTEVTIYDYIGDEKNVVISNLIDGLPVTKIGFGFNSISDFTLDLYFDYNEVIDESLLRMNQVIIPSGVKEIENGAFYNSLYSLTYIPSSVEKIGIYVGRGWNDEFYTNKLIFESAKYPIFVGSNFDDEDINNHPQYVQAFDSSGIYYRGIDLDKIYFDENTKSWYIEDLFGYTLIQYFNLCASKIIIEASVNGKTVHTIGNGAVKGIRERKEVIIKDGIKKIKSYAFNFCDKFLYVFIPNSVETINANGFGGKCDRFFTSHTYKPSEWDSQWAGCSYTITYNVEEDGCTCLSDDGYYEYLLLEDGTIALLKYLGDTSNVGTVNVKRTLDGYEVSEIRANCFELKYYYTINIYIPKNIKLIEENAFVRTSKTSTTNVYFEAEKKLEGYHDNYINVESSYLVEKFGKTFSY